MDRGFRPERGNDGHGENSRVNLCLDIFERLFIAESGCRSDDFMTMLLLDGIVFSVANEKSVKKK
jgi:hypothetical protein